MISKWNYLPFTSEQQSIADELSIRFPGCSTISRLMALRGITSLDEVEKFLNPSLSDLHDPFLMQDMDKAVNRLNKALGRKEKILIYGDYDVDGITSVALVYRYLQNYYSNVEYYIPTRYEEGYGVSDKSIDFAASLGVSLIIVLDCGIKAVEEIEYAKSKGIDFIICDHLAMTYKERYRAAPNGGTITYQPGTHRLAVLRPKRDGQYARPFRWFIN